MSFVDCRICYVDPSRNVCDAISCDGRSFIENIEYLDSGMKQTGQVRVPEYGDVIVVEMLADGQARLHRYYPGRTTSPENLVALLTNIPGAADLLPGDQLFTGPDGAFLKLFRGGMAAMGTSPLAQTVYLAIEGLVRTVAQNYELMSSGCRVYSMNDNGKVLTRLCFNSLDVCFSKGANNNQTLESENFEFQIDIDSDGFTFFAGEINPDSNKRRNNLVITIQQNGDLHLVSGNKELGNITLIDVYATGATSFKVLDENDNVIYDKSVTATSSGKVLVSEIVIGDIIRKIDGNLYEEVTGSRNVKSDLDSVSSNVIEASASMNKRISGMNVNEVQKVPNTDITVK